MEMRITALYRYPIKSCAGESLSESIVDRRGLAFDRRWLVVDENGMFVAQRGERGRGVGIRSMCLVRPVVKKDCVAVNAPQMPPLFFPLSAKTEGKDLLDVQVWSAQCKAIEVSRACSSWFTEYLSRERPGTYRLVRIADDFTRKTSIGIGELAFADGYPFLIISEESLAELNKRVEGTAIPMDRFRPNIVISGCKAHAEDEMKQLFIEGMVFQNQKPCDRCAIPATDQATGAIDSRPLRALAEYRRWSNAEGRMKVWFGSNFTHRGEGILRVGSAVELL